jgi:Zinc finger, C3HC4 type (RING finger)
LCFSFFLSFFQLVSDTSNPKFWATIGQDAIPERLRGRLIPELAFQRHRLQFAQHGLVSGLRLLKRDPLSHYTFRVVSVNAAGAGEVQPHVLAVATNAMDLARDYRVLAWLFADAALHDLGTLLEHCVPRRVFLGLSECGETDADECAHSEEYLATPPSDLDLFNADFGFDSLSLSSTNSRFSAAVPSLPAAAVASTPTVSTAALPSAIPALTSAPFTWSAAAAAPPAHSSRASSAASNERTPLGGTAAHTDADGTVSPSRSPSMCSSSSSPSACSPMTASATAATTTTKVFPSSCVVCMDRRANVALVPCGHLGLCEPCSNKVSTCPLCRTAITHRQTVFIV